MQKLNYAQAGKLFNLFALLAVLSFTLQGCATAGYENVDTTRKAILVATAETRGANLLLQDLVTRNAIDDDSAREALAALRSAAASLQTALNAVDVAGDPLTAETTLARANQSINIALILLSQFTGEP
jgi:hypothetical protein